jgi:Protein of unknown function, DUF547
MAKVILRTFLLLSLGLANTAGLAAMSPQTEAVSSRVEFDQSHGVFNGLLKEYVHAAGMVDYKGLAQKRATLDGYLASLQAVTSKMLNSWTPAEQQAFWINAYNGFTLQLILDNYPVDSIKNLGGFFSSVFSKRYIPLQHLSHRHSKKLSLGEIEHEILFKQGRGPMFHFAIVCASASCPELRPEAFVGQKLDAQLADQARLFLADASKNDQTVQGGRLRISKIFDWSEDELDTFKGGIRALLSKYGPPEIGRVLAKNKVKLKYRSYDWNLNEWHPPKNSNL